MKKALRKSAAAAAALVCLLSAAGITASAAQIDNSQSVSANSAQAVSEDDSNELPSRYSSAELGYTSPVRRQGYNDCWVYATLNSLESKLLKMGYEDVQMNTSHFNMWATKRSNDKGWIRDYTDAGFCSTALGYITSWSGGVLSSDLPVYDLSFDVHGDEVPTNLTRYGVTGIEYLENTGADSLKRAIMENGGLYAAFGLNSMFFQKSTSAFFIPKSSTDSYAGHAVEIIGWDDDFAVSNFKEGYQPENPGAWLVKNSNGLGDYFWISYEDKYLFSDRFSHTYTIKSVIEIDDKMKLLQNEIYGATYEFNYERGLSQTFVNKLPFDDEHRFLDSVTFETTSRNADYSLYYIPETNGELETDSSLWSLIGTGNTGNGGYINTDADDFYVESEGGAVAVSITVASGRSTIGVGEWLINGTSMQFINESEHGESYIYKNGSFTDLMDWYADNNDDEIGGTFVIKAVAKSAPDVLTGDVNLDGMVDINDSTEIQRHLANILRLTPKQLAAADMDGDGEITVNDCTTIQKFIANIPI